MRHSRGVAQLPLLSTMRVGSNMTISIKSIVACGCLGAAILALSACSPRRIATLSVADLMEDRVALDGVLLKCNQNQSNWRTESNCLNARIAIERLASQSEPAIEAKRAVEFERTRERLRLAQEKQRQDREAKTKVDVYTLPLVPVEPTLPPTAPPANEPNPPLARGSNP
jgi:hypothetical protein